jgi:hypothetical protein
MKRDMDLIRKMLLALESEEPSEIAWKDVKEGYSEEQYAYHGNWLIDSGLVEGSSVTDGQGLPSGNILLYLTWNGCDFLDSIRDASIWEKTKANLLKPGASMTFALIKEYATFQVKQKLGIIGS